jgi:hypothetical protein
MLPILGLAIMTTASAVEFSFEESREQLDLQADGSTWLSTVTIPYDAEKRVGTYKVFTHMYDFDGTAPITKGVGGKYTHHRGLFIGWNHTRVGDKEFDTWHMSSCYQQHVAWLANETTPENAKQVQEVHWCDENGTPFVKEIRTITAQPGRDGLRIFDFRSELTSLAGKIEFRGDLQHAGMQVRMANEVSEHQDSTEYLLPKGAQELDDDKVVGAWWVCCSPVVRDTRYWVIHMTPKDHLTGEPVYSIRRYARFGAFFEPELEEGTPLVVNFRVVLSQSELDQNACEALYQEYAP